MRNLLILAKWLAAKANVDLEQWNEQTAAITQLESGRKVIYIPNHWSYTVDPEAAELLEGVIDHEALGHGRFTDLLGRKKAEEAKQIKWNELSSAIQNILEDIYIENRAISTYPGVKANLSKTVEILRNRGFFGDPDSFNPQEPAGNLIITGLLNVLRCHLIPGQKDHLLENSTFFNERLEELLGRTWTEVLAIACEVKNSQSTQDNIDLTVRIMDKIKDIAKSEAQESQDSQQGQSGDGEDSSSDSSGSQGEGDEEGDSPANGQGQDASDKPSNQPGQGSSSGSYSEQEIDAAKAIIAQQNQAKPETEITDGASGQISKGCGSGAGSGNLTEAKKTSPLDPVAVKVSKQLKNTSDELMDALVSETRSAKSNRMIGKRLNSRVLSRVRTGNPNVFSSKTEGNLVSTAISILTDDSGSMTDKLADGIRRSEAAKGLMVGIADILDEFEVSFEMNVYSDSFATHKSFDSDWTQIKRQQVMPSIGGGTITGAAMEKALGNLVVQPEERKLLIIITDGDTSDLDTLMSCYSEAQLMGVEIASIMVGPMIPSIAKLADRFGFKAVSSDKSSGIGRFAVERVLEAI